MQTLCGRPRWHTFAAYADGAPIGGAALFIDGDNAWLGMAAALPARRKYGGQRALLARRIGTAGNVPLAGPSTGVCTYASKTGCAADTKHFRRHSSRPSPFPRSAP